MKRVSLLLALTLVLSTSAALEANLVNRSTTVSNSYVHNYPIVSMVVENEGDGTATIKGVNFESGKGHVVESPPSSILPGRAGVFSFRVSKMGCQDLDESYEYNISIRYGINSTHEDFVNYSGSFQVGNPLGMNTTQQTIALYTGEVVDYGVVLVNSGAERVRYNVSMDPGFYVQLLLHGDIYNIGDLDTEEFDVLYADLLTLRLFGTEVLQKSFDFKVTDVSCPGMSLTKRLFVKTYTKTGGIISVDVSPDMDTYSILIVLLLGALAIAKIYKTG